MQSRKQKNKPGRPASGQSLSPQLVVEAAVQILDSEGLGALSMRRLGQVLGVEAMALYNHFEDKDALLDAVANLLLTTIPLPSSKGSWRSRFKALCQGMRGAARHRPNLFRLAMTRPIPPSAALPLIEFALEALEDAGLNLKTRVTAYHTCWLYVRGFCLWEIEEFVDRPDPVDLVTMAEEYPRAAAATELIFRPDLDRQFEKGLDIILQGLSK